MKILMLTDGVARGGKERRMLELIADLGAYAPDVEIFLLSFTDRVEYAEVYSLPIRFAIMRRRFARDPSPVPKLRQLILAWRPDVIHSWGTMASVYASIANLGTGIPFINGVLADATPGLTVRDKHYLRVKLTTPFTDVFVSNSQAGIEAYRTPHDRSLCIYNGIRFSRFRDLPAPVDVERELLGGPKNGRFVAVMVAAFEPRKDHRALVDAAVRCCAASNDIVFLLVGTGPTLESTRARVPPDLLDRRIVFTGQRTDAEAVIQVADVGLLISRHGEGVANVILEYMALRKPVIATAIGGTPEVVRDHFNGFLVEPRNADQIVARIQQLMANPGLAAELGRNGRTFCMEHFDVRGKTEEYLQLYRRLDEGRQNSRWRLAPWT